MTKPKKGEFVVHCIMCGKDFRVGDKAECGGIYIGKTMCKTGDIQRELDSRLPAQKVFAEALDDAWKVIITVEGESSDEADMLNALQNRMERLSLHARGVTLNQ